MEQFPELQTERLQLNELRASDVPRIVEYAANKRISDYTLNLPHPYAEKDAIYWLNLANQGLRSDTHLVLAVRLNPGREFIGGISLTIEQRFKRAEVGYWIAEPFWNQGYATEATTAIIKFAFDHLGLNKITSSHLDKNPASGRVMVNCGMNKEGELKEHIYKDAAYHALVLYGLTKSDYEKNREGRTPTPAALPGR